MSNSFAIAAVLAMHQAASQDGSQVTCPLNSCGKTWPSRWHHSQHQADMIVVAGLAGTEQPDQPLTLPNPDDLPDSVVDEDLGLVVRLGQPYPEHSDDDLRRAWRDGYDSAAVAAGRLANAQGAPPATSTREPDLGLDALMDDVWQWHLRELGEGTVIAKTAKVAEEAGELIGHTIKSTEPRPDAAEHRHKAHLEVADVILSVLAAARAIGVTSVDALVRHKWAAVRQRRFATATQTVEQLAGWYRGQEPAGSVTCHVPASNGSPQMQPSGGAR